MSKLYKAIGLMSGTSMDGIDLALIESDGQNIINRQSFAYTTYTEDLKEKLQNIIYKAPDLETIKDVENELTLIHANLVNDFLAKNNISKDEIDLVAFHGHTILHIPEKNITWQIGNGHLLAEKTGIDVICDFRSKDVYLGGQGAPLVPIYHFYLLSDHQKPCALLNIGGISNITYFNSNDENEIKAFDVCFGNAPFDDLMKEKFKLEFDANGTLSQSGKADKILADRILQNEIFHKEPPKSFDRDDFATLIAPIKSLESPQDALATFAYMHAKALEFNLKFLKQKPSEIFICGGGRRNQALMQEMQQQLPDIKVAAIEEIKLNGDAIEAEAFAFLGIRSLLGLPISFKNTTGVASDACGGVLIKCSQ